MAFRPIDDIKDFVYSYVLDEKEVNIDILRENVRTYQDLENTLKIVKEKIGKLLGIEKYHAQVMDGATKDAMYDYYLERAKADITKEEIKDLEQAAAADEIRLKEQNIRVEQVSREKSEKQEIRDNLRTELASDKDFIARDEQKKRLSHLENRKAELEPERQRLLNSVKQAKDGIMRLISATEESECLLAYQDNLSHVETMEEYVEFKQNLQAVIDYKMAAYNEKQMQQAKTQMERQSLTNALADIDGKIEQLKKKRLSYPTDVHRVLEAIKTEFHRIGREAEPRILCELLEISDDAWRNAVEGYLNTQRFYILVEPESFDIALGTYDRLRKERKAYGVGLINTQKLDSYEKAPEGSLATVVTSKNIHAKKYVNMILGKVQMCEHYSQLKQYPTSITKECMKYQNHVASAIKPAIYETPYIGKNAIKVQLEQALEQQKQLRKQLKEKEEQLEQIKRILCMLNTEADTDVKYRIDILPEIRAVADEILKCKANIATLEQNTNMLQKQIQLSALEEMILELEKTMLKLSQKAGSIEERISSTKEKIEDAHVEYVERKAFYAKLYTEAGDAASLWEQEYAKQTKDKTFTQFYENYSRRKKANLTTMDTAEKNMEKEMVAYKTAHDFGAAPTMEGYPAFAAEYEKLYGSELLSYEEKVQSAKNAAEEEFREQFLSKLQENMKIAQGEFKELNKALNDISFSNEKYEFLYMPSRRYRQYYEMIMDDFNAMQGESIFSGLFNENHKEVIDELFEKLALDSENHAKALDEFTDYRTYMDYDIKIIHSDGNYSYYSKVCEEKSGGETQTPFYVTVAASFVQLYRNNIGGEAIGLVMFDEAFNNMDDERIGGVLEFLRRLPLQIVIAAPPDKIQYISPFIEETLLVMTDEKVSFVERYHNGAI